MIQVTKGDRVELVSCTDPFIEMAPGTRGIVMRDYDENDLTVQTQNEHVQVRWDNGLWLSLIPEAGDAVRVVDEPDAFCPECMEPGEPMDYTAKNACGWWRCANGHEFEHRVRQNKVPTLVQCQYAHAPEAHGIKNPDFQQYAEWACDDETCRSMHKIA